MPTRTTSITLLLLSLAGTGGRYFTFRANSLSEPASRGDNPKLASRGDAVTGELVREDQLNHYIDIDATPCAGRHVVRFVSPYKREDVGMASCGIEGKKFYAKVLITQH